MKKPSAISLVFAALLGLAAGSTVAADLSATRQAALRQEVLQAMHGMLAAEERLDAAAVWAYHADVPDYLWADIDGQLYDFAGTKKDWADFYAGCAKLKFTTKREEVMVLGPDLAFYLWHGSADVTGKDGAVSRGDPWTARYLLRRIGGAWKMVGGQESSPPAQPVTPPVGMAAPAMSAAEARAALESYILEFWNKHDAAALARAFSPTMVYHYNGEVIPGTPVDHLGYQKDFGGAFPDLAGSIDRFAFSDGIGAAATTWTGTHKGELAGIAATGNKPISPTGRKIKIATNYVFRVEGGKIVELWEAWDEGALYLKLSQPEPAATK